MDSKFFHVLEKIIDFLVLNIAFLVCCIPVLTIGPAISALYYQVHKQLFGGRGYVRDYFTAFKNSFKTAFGAWIVTLLVGLFLCIDIRITGVMYASGEAMGSLWMVFLVLLVVLFTYQVFLFAYIARFDDGLKVSLGNAFKLMMGNPLSALGLMVMLVIFIVFTWLRMMFIFIMPGLYLVLAHSVLEACFRKNMTPEQLEHEDKLLEIENY